ncbi:ABC transporter ATP-binding protein/permease [Candidatus Gracilibacteria bacterium]|nr:ABC transporter ATP-binding protein/permease [Candidatus Gracilibacteria bacterium]
MIFTKIIEEIEAYFVTGLFDERTTLGLIVFWAIFIVFSVIIQFAYRYFFVYKNNMKNYVELCKKFNRRVLCMGYDTYLSSKQGSIYKIYDRGTQGQESFLYFFFGEIVRTFFSISIIIFILFQISVIMTLLALSMVPVMFLIAYFFTLHLSKKQRVLNDKWDSMFGDIGNALTSFMLTKTLSLERVFLGKMDTLLDKVHVEQNKVGRGWSFANVYVGLLVMVSRLLVLGFGVFFVIDGSLTFAELFLVFSFIGWIYFPLGFIIDRFNEMIKHLTSVEKMYQQFDSISREDTEIGRPLTSVSGEISFKGVSFSYHTENPILKNISFSVRSGETLALVGHTGSGKSTIVNLLLRFWDIEKGSIMLDGIDIQEIQKKSLRSTIGIVSQDNSLFNLSIRDNLLFAKEDASEKELHKALKNAQADFVFNLPEGIDTIIGERGLKLSGGEKQRISIARLFLKNPEILILDEATSALDTATEKKIDLALKKLMKGKTSIIIAHRISTIRHADAICVLESGKIVELGQYEELMNKQGKFYTLANPDKLILG